MPVSRRTLLAGATGTSGRALAGYAGSVAHVGEPSRVRVVAAVVAR